MEPAAVYYEFRNRVSPIGGELLQLDKAQGF
jgi:hypothetical protein